MNDHETSPIPKRLPVLGWLSWMAVLLMLVAVIARLVWHDGHLLLVWINSFTAYFYLPAYAIGLVAAWRRYWKLASASLLIVVCHLVWMWPDFQAPSQLTKAVEAAPRVRLFSANLYTGNHQYAAMITEIRNADADVLMFQEWTPRWSDALIGAGVLKDYPYHIALPQTGAFGLAVYSKQPLEQEEIWLNAGLPTGRVTLSLGKRKLRLYNLHSMPPRDGNKVARGNEYWRELLELLANETGPTVLIGDLNATQHSYWLQRLSLSGYRSAHVDRGRGFAVTWPNDRSLLIPPIRVDHCLLSPQVACLAIEEGQGLGSDHRPLLVELAVPGESDQPADLPN